MTFWDDVRRGAQTVVEEGQKVGRLARLKARVRALEDQLGELIHQLGTKALDLHRRNELHHHELDELFVAITALQRELRERQEEINMLLGRRRTDAFELPECPACGGVIHAGDRFCRHCGQHLTGA